MVRSMAPSVWRTRSTCASRGQVFERTAGRIRSDLIGQKLAHFEVTAKLGEGGMGEVYRATDTKLGREVALKALPDAFALDEQRMARFSREAQVLASLNHPNIGAIFGLEEEDGRKVLVLELIEGETLADRIAKGPLPLTEALGYALSIAEALEAAHEKGVVHRDLKPANVKVTPEDKIKVLDFGLAKALGDDVTSDPELSHSPTLTLAATQAGVILGTAGYMAPEQARGKPVDRRADIWAFGVILFEMLTARKAFGGETVSDTLAKILEREPEWDALPATTPEPIRRLLRRCLTKEPADRLQAIGDARITISDYLADPEAYSAPAATPAQPVWMRLLPWALIPVAALVAWVLRPQAPQGPAPVIRASIDLTSGDHLRHSSRHGIAISADGSQVAFRSNSDLADPTAARISTRRLDQFHLNRMDILAAATNPTFSPDGQWLAYYDPAEQRLKKVPIASGTPITLCAVQEDPLGVDWTENGFILFAGSHGGLLRVSASGGEPEEVTALDEEADEISHRLPHVLPGGRVVLFTVLRVRSVGIDWATVDVFAQDLETGERSLILENASDARYAPTGNLVFARDAMLLAVPFDLESLSTRGEPVPLVEGVDHAIYATSGGSNSGAAQFAFSETGTLVYVPGGVSPNPNSSAIRIDRSGEQTELPLDPRPYLGVKLSPKGDQLLTWIDDGRNAIWLVDPLRGNRSRQVDGAVPLWMPDGEHFVFHREGGIHLKAIDSNTAPEELDAPRFSHLTSVSPDGTELAVVVWDGPRETNADIWILAVDGESPPRRFLETPEHEAYAEFSPDGRWMAYTSIDGDQWTVFVQSYPKPGRRIQVSSSGGFAPAWSRNGTEIIYLRREGIETEYWVTPLSFEGNRLEAGQPERIVRGYFGITGPARAYDVDRDGRILTHRILDPAERVQFRAEHSPTRIQIVHNWFEELKQLVPVN